MKKHFKAAILVMAIISAKPAFSLDYYWVGGTGNWSDYVTHWATSTGGSSFHSQVPSSVDNVYFDVNSFSAPGQTVTVNTAAYCADMDWTGSLSPVLSGSSAMNVYGSLTLTNTVTVSGFSGSWNFCSTSTGKAITSAGKQYGSVNFNGAGGEWTLQDSMYVTGDINLNYGSLVSNDQNIRCNSFFTQGGAVTLTLGSSRVTIYSRYRIKSNCTLNSGTSLVRFPNGGTLDWGNNRVYYDVEFVGSASIQTYNATYNNVTFYSDASIGNDVNTFNTVNLTPGKIYTFVSGYAQTVTSLNATGNCVDMITIKSSGAGSKATINSSTSQTVSFVSLKDMNASGAIPFTANNSVDAGNNSNWNIISTPRNLYWIPYASNNNWNEGNHWSTTSGGSACGCPPTSQDNVYFDANSFTPAYNTVTINVIANCNNMDWTGATNNPVLQVNSSPNIYGSLTLIQQMTISGGTWYFYASSTGKTITTSGKQYGAVNFNGVGGEWTLQDSMYVTGDINLNYGSLVSNDQNIRCNSFFTQGGAVTLTLGSSTVTINSRYRIKSNCTLNSGTSLVRFPNGGTLDFGNSRTYYNVEFIGSASIQTYNATYNNVTFYSDASIGNEVNTFNTVNLTPGKIYTFVSGYAQTVTTFNATGNCSNLITIKSSGAGSRATINSAVSQTVTYVSLKDMNASGAIPFTANNSVDAGNNLNWNISSTPRDLYWIPYAANNNWNEGNHWSTTSGGSACGCPPTSLDNVYFDANSFTPAYNTVTVNVIANCNNMDWTGATNNPVFQVNFTTNIYGSLTFIPQMTTTGGTWYFYSPATGKTITSSGKQYGAVNFNGIGGEWTLQDSMYVTGDINLNYGSLVSNDQNIRCNNFYTQGGAVWLTLGSSTVRIYSRYRIKSNCTLNSGTSLVLFPAGGILDWGPGITYYDVLFNGSASIQTYGATYHDVIFGSDASIGNESNTFNSMTFTSGKTYTFVSGYTQTITTTGIIYIPGTPSFPTRVQASSAGSHATISKASGDVCGDYLRISDIYVAGGANFFAGANSQDMGGNNGWVWATCSNPPVLTLNSGDAYCANDTNGWAKANVSGGMPPYTFLWSNSETTDSIYNLAPGMYIVTVTDDLSLTDVDTVIINSIYSIPVSYNLSGGGLYCTETSAPTVALDGSESGVSYQLLYGGTPLWAAENGTGLSIDFGEQTQAGIYTSEATNAYGCKTTMSGSANVSIYNCSGSYLSVAINSSGAAADTAAMLEVSDYQSGILFPRLDSLQRDALIAPDTGLIVYNTDSKRFNYFDGDNWMQVSCSFVSAVTGAVAVDYGTAINAGGSSPALSAMLDVSSTTKGALIPRTLPGAIYGVKEGSVIYNIYTKTLNYYNGTWVALSAATVSAITGAGSQTPDGCAVNMTNAVAAASAMLDVKAQNKAVLIPRLTEAQRAALLPATGLMIYNKTSKFIEYWNGTGWMRMQ